MSKNETSYENSIVFSDDSDIDFQPKISKRQEKIKHFIGREVVRFF